MNCPSKGKGTGSEGGGEGADAEGRCCHCLALAKQPHLQMLMGWEERVLSSPCHSHLTKMLCWWCLVLIYRSSFWLKGVLWQRRLQAPWDLSLLCIVQEPYCPKSLKVKGETLRKTHINSARSMPQQSQVPTSLQTKCVKQTAKRQPDSVLWI